MDKTIKVHCRFLTREATIVYILLYLTICVSAGCKDKPPATVDTAMNDWDNVGIVRPTTMHRLKTIQLRGWKIQLWLSGSTFMSDSDIDATLRLYAVDNMASVGKNARISCILTSKTDQTLTRTVTHNGIWIPTADLGDRWEVTFDNGKLGKAVQSPKQGNCWELSIDNVMNRNIDDKNERSLPIGEFQLTVSVELDTGVSFTFEPVKIVLIKDYVRD